MLNLDPGMMIWGWATFLVLLILLYKVAWKPILSTIDKRENTIQGSLDSAKNAQEEAEKLLSKHQEMIKSAEQEAQNLIRENKELDEDMKVNGNDGFLLISEENSTEFNRKSEGRHRKGKRICSSFTQN